MYSKKSPNTTQPSQYTITAQKQEQKYGSDKNDKNNHRNKKKTTNRLHRLDTNLRNRLPHTKTNTIPHVQTKLKDTNNMKKIHVRITGFYINDTTHPEFMENFKEELETLLRKKGILFRPWVQEIIIGKQVKTI